MRIQTREGFGEELMSQDGSEVSGHDCLLLHRAVVLQRQDHWVWRCLEQMKKNTADRLGSVQVPDLKHVVFRTVTLGRTHFESVLVDDLDDLDKWDFGGQGVSMVDDGFSFVPVPTVQFHTAAAVAQSPEDKQVTEFRRFSPDHVHKPMFLSNQQSTDQGSSPV